MPGSAVRFGFAAVPSIGRAGFLKTSAPNGCWRGAFGGGSLGELVVRESGTGAGQWSGPARTVGWYRG